MTSADTLYRRKRRDNQRALGLCQGCNTKLTDGRSRCPVCHSAHVAREVARKQDREKRGVCVNCARPLDDPASKTCIVCRETYHFNPFARG